MTTCPDLVSLLAELDTIERELTETRAQLAAIESSEQTDSKDIERLTIEDEKPAATDPLARLRQLLNKSK